MRGTLRFGGRPRRVGAAFWAGSHGSRRWSVSVVCALAITLGLVVAGLQSSPHARQATRQEASATGVSPGAGTVTGRVTSADGGQPVAGARVQLTYVPESSPGTPSMNGTETRGVVDTDASGAFAFPAVPSGRYTVSVAGPSGTMCRTSPAAVALSGGTARLEFQIERTSSVAGRVMADGRPVAGAVVSLLSWSGPALGPRRLSSPVRRGGAAAAPARLTTGERGEFVFPDVPAGEYYLVALETFRRPSGQFEPRVGLLPTYYPSSTLLASARPVAVGSGQTVEGLDIGMVRGRFAQVSGRVVDSTGRPLLLGPTGSLALYRVSVDRSALPSSSVVRFGATPRGGGDSGSFLFPDVVPGDYYLVASVRSPDDPGTGERYRAEVRSSSGPDAPVGQRYWDREGAIVRIHVQEGRDQKVDVRTSPGATVSGRVVVEGQPSGRPLDQEATLVITPDDELLSSSFATVRRAPVHDGAFTIPRVRGPMTVSVEAPGLAVKSVARGTDDWTARSIDLTGTERVSDVLVTMTREVASLEGVVTGTRGTVLVIVYPEDRSRWRAPYLITPRASSSEAARLALTAAGAPPPAGAAGQQAFFSVPALLPGRYLVTAVPVMRDDSLPLDAWLETLTPRATRVTLSAGDHQRVTVAAAN